MNTINFPPVDENDRDALMNQRGQLISRLAAIEEALREEHGSDVRTV
jgi:hypothetical protein